MCAENRVYKGLDDEEFAFLEGIQEKAHQRDQKRWIEEAEHIKQFRISNLVTIVLSELVLFMFMFVWLLLDFLTAQPTPHLTRSR